MLDIIKGRLLIFQLKTTAIQSHKSPQGKQQVENSYVLNILNFYKVKCLGYVVGQPRETKIEWKIKCEKLKPYYVPFSTKQTREIRLHAFFSLRSTFL